jgi:hypothetical protein
MTRPTFGQHMLCPRCRGSGTRSRKNPEPCLLCLGTGFDRELTPVAPPKPQHLPTAVELRENAVRQVTESHRPNG